MIFISPHNDDEVLFGAYLICQHDPQVVVAYDSYVQVDRGRSDCSAAARRQETIEGLKALGSTKPPIFLGLSDREIDPDDLEEALRPIVLDAIAEDSFVAYPAFLSGGNRHHNLVAGIMRRFDIDQERRVEYMTYTLHGKHVLGSKVSCTPEMRSRKMLALLKYSSQITNPETAPHFLDQRVFDEYVA